MGVCVRAVGLASVRVCVLTVVGSEGTTKLKASPHRGLRDAGMTELEGGEGGTQNHEQGFKRH